MRDGLGFLTWVESFNDTTTEAGQIKALASFAKFKYPIDTTVLQLRKGLLDSLAVWGTITGNDKSDRVKLDSFYKATRDKFAKQPDSHPIVRVRAKIADFIYDDSPMLKNVDVFIERVVEYARSVGVAEGGGNT